LLKGDEAVGGVAYDVFDDRDGLGGWAGLRFREVEGGDLQSVEQQTGAPGVDDAQGDALQDEADSCLDGAAVLGQWEVEDLALGHVAARGRFGPMDVVVIEAEEFAAEGATAAAAAVGEDVAALVGFRLSFGLDFGHKCGDPTPPESM